MAKLKVNLDALIPREDFEIEENLNLGTRKDKISISIDHIKRKQDGGLATVNNGQLTHLYCNTGYKKEKRGMEL